MEWQHQRFGQWLKYQRVIVKDLSQDRLAAEVGVTQSQISRWELGPDRWPNTEPPTLEECLSLADVFEVNFIELAKLCGRWNDRIQQRVLISLAQNDLSDAPVAQVSGIVDLDVYRQLRPAS